jgi:hypothetical protein
VTSRCLNVCPRIQSEPPALVDKGGVLVVRAESLSDLANITQHERDRRVLQLLKYMVDDLLFEALTPLGFHVRVTRSYWELILTVKHPVMEGRESDVEDTLENPDEIRQSRSDPAVYLFYRLERPGRWVCAVAKRLDGEGFLITTYPTDAIKEGVGVWRK